MTNSREGGSAVVRTVFLCVVGVALALGGYVIGRHSGGGQLARSDVVPSPRVGRSSGEAEDELAMLAALSGALETNLSGLAAKSGLVPDDLLSTLTARYRQLAAGEERDELLRRILLKTQLQIGRTRDLKDLAFFREFITSPQSTRRERHAAMVVGHPLGRQSIPDVLAYYEEGLGTSDSTVRAFAAEGLAWIQGQEQSRAREILRKLVFDTDPLVRQMAAGCLAAIVREPKDADLLARALEVETEALAATEILDAIKALDAAGYRSRLENASKRAKPAILPLIKERLTATNSGGAGN